MKNQDINTEKPCTIHDVVVRFSKEQTLSNIGELRKLGVGLKILNNNKWQRLSEYKLPFERFIPLYDDNFKICDIGVY
jgi:hypothetical protein